MVEHKGAKEGAFSDSKHKSLTGIWWICRSSVSVLSPPSIKSPPNESLGKRGGKGAERGAFLTLKAASADI